MSAGAFGSESEFDHAGGYDSAAAPDYLLPEGRIARRARGWHVYDSAGARYLDFWQADGAALLGHRPRGLGRLIAAELDRGLLAGLPTAWAARSTRALQRLAERAGLNALEPLNGVELREPSVRWLPLAAPEDDLLLVQRDRNSPADLLRPPARPSTGPDSREQLAAWVIVPVPGLAWGPASVVRAAFTRMTLQLLNYIDSSEARAREEAAAALPVPRGYRRSGIWMLPEHEGSAPAVVSPEVWATHRRTAASRGILLPPDARSAILVPGEMSGHEQKLWKELVNEWPD